MGEGPASDAESESDGRRTEWKEETEGEREIVPSSSIVAGEAHTDCSGIAVIFKVTHTNPCSGEATCKQASGGESFATSKFVLHLYLSHSHFTPLQTPYLN